MGSNMSITSFLIEWLSVVQFSTRPAIELSILHCYGNQSLMIAAFQVSGTTETGC